MERIAKDSNSYGSTHCLSSWSIQHALYNTILGDTTFADSSAILRSFFASAVGTRYGWLSNIDLAIASGKDSLAEALLARPPRTGSKAGSHNVRIQDLSCADGLVANYDTFYHFYFSSKKNGLDSLAMASLKRFAAKCPLLEGPAIYQARALLRSLSGDTIVYKDSCSVPGRVSDTIEKQKGAADRRSASEGFTKQQYSLIPNPNDGRMQLIQALEDEMPVKITVYNALGSIVYSSDKVFEGKATSLDLSVVAPGLYKMILHDSAGSNYTLKFIKR